MFIAMILSKSPHVGIFGKTVSVAMPKGLCGVLYAFETEADAKAWYGEDVVLFEIREKLNIPGEPLSPKAKG